MKKAKYKKSYIFSSQNIKNKFLYCQLIVLFIKIKVLIIFFSK
jgi:hypothetical protein